PAPRCAPARDLCPGMLRGQRDRRGREEERPAFDPLQLAALLPLAVGAESPEKKMRRSASYRVDRRRSRRSQKTIRNSAPGAPQPPPPPPLCDEPGFETGAPGSSSTIVMVAVAGFPTE